ncbi:hypothetical protein [Methanobrevibacter sp.]|uniref:hypothetical protein n=1 Tax=Methanobrevibacter sp. TaxID=66852 RepID=UPI003864CC15
MAGVDSVTNVLFTNRNKMILGIISIIFGIIVFFLTSAFVPFYLVIPFFILAICLIVPSDVVKNSKIIGVIFVLYSLFVIYSTITVVLNPYDVVTNLYLSGQFSTTPGASEVSACFNAFLIALIYAIYNLVCSFAFFFKTSGEGDFV